MKCCEICGTTDLQAPARQLLDPRERLCRHCLADAVFTDLDSDAGPLTIDEYLARWYVAQRLGVWHAETTTFALRELAWLNIWCRYGISTDEHEPTDG